MQSSNQKARFGDIVDKNKMIEQLKQSGKIHVKIIFHYSATKTAQKGMWCDKVQPFIRLARPIRQFFKISEIEGVFYYINKKIPDQTKSLQFLAGEADNLVVDVATSQIF